MRGRGEEGKGVGVLQTIQTGQCSRYVRLGKEGARRGNIEGSRLLLYTIGLQILQVLLLANSASSTEINKIIPAKHFCTGKKVFIHKNFETC